MWVILSSIISISILICVAIGGVAWWIGDDWRPASHWYREYLERGPRRAYRWHCPPLPVWPAVMARDHPLNRPGVNWTQEIQNWSSQLITYSQFCDRWGPFFCARERSRPDRADECLDPMKKIWWVVGGDITPGWWQPFLEILWQGVDQWRLLKICLLRKCRNSNRDQSCSKSPPHGVNQAHGGLPTL